MEEELASLPGKYSAPGRTDFYWLLYNDQPAGCVALAQNRRPVHVT